MAEDVSGFPKGHGTKELQMSLMNRKGALHSRNSCITMKYTAKNQDSMARAQPSCKYRDQSMVVRYI